MDLLTRRGASPLRIKIDSDSSPLKNELKYNKSNMNKGKVLNSTKNTPKDLNVPFKAINSKIRKSSRCVSDMKTPDISPISFNGDNNNRQKCWISPYFEILERNLTPLKNISSNLDNTIGKNRSFCDLNKSFRKCLDTSTDSRNSSILSDDIFEVMINSPVDENRNFYKMLHKNCLDNCIPIFKEHEIDLDVFLTLSHDDLREIGIELSLQPKILDLINQLRNMY